MLCIGSQLHLQKRTLMVVEKSEKTSVTGPKISGNQSSNNLALFPDTHKHKRNREENSRNN